MLYFLAIFISVVSVISIASEHIEIKINKQNQVKLLSGIKKPPEEIRAKGGSKDRPLPQATKVQIKIDFEEKIAKH